MMRTAARYLAPALVALSAILAIANWYVSPERSGAWAISLAFIAFLLVPMWLVGGQLFRLWRTRRVA